MEYSDEKQVAKQAEKMLTAALRAGVSGFAAHVKRADDKKSLRDAVAKATVKKYGKKENGTLNHYMRRLSIKMERHGFVQHFGVDTLRNAGTRTRRKPKETTYAFRSHYFGLPAKPFINQVVDRSGVVPFVTENVTRLRAEELLFFIKKVLEK